MSKTPIDLSDDERQRLLARLRQARGIWENRDDQPDWRDLREELDRVRP